jgi:hypothetical protein
MWYRDVQYLVTERDWKSKTTSAETADLPKTPDPKRQ